VGNIRSTKRLLGLNIDLVVLRESREYLCKCTKVVSADFRILRKFRKRRKRKRKIHTSTQK
jgi:hypothetical protein